MGQYEAQAYMDIPIDKVSLVACTTLRRFACADVFLADEMQTVRTTIKRNEIIYGLEWSYLYRVEVSWEEDSTGTLIKVHVAEDKYPFFDSDTKEIVCKLLTQLEKDWGALQDFQQTQDKQSSRSVDAADSLIEAGYVDSHMSSENFLITKLGNLFIRLTIQDSQKQVLVVGPTGSGKTSGICEPNLFERTETSAIVTEATGIGGSAGLYQKTSGYRQSKGHKIYYFNTDDLHSHRINPLDQVHSYRDAMRVAEILMQATTLRTHRGDQFWEMSERLLLISLILYAVGEREAGNCNFGFVRDLLNTGTDNIQLLMAATKISKAREEFEAFIKNSTDNQRNLVAQGLAGRLSLWAQPRIRELTRVTDINFDSLGNELFTLYLSTPAAKLELKPLAALIFNMVLEMVSEIKRVHPLMLLLDEFTNFGRIPGMAERLTILRHDGVPVVLGVQSAIQLELVYDKEAPLFWSQTGTKIIFKPNDLQTAEEISKCLGMAEKLERKVDSSGHIRETIDNKPVMSPEKILALKPGQILAFTPNATACLLAALTWENYKTETNTETYPPPEGNQIEVSESLISGEGTAALASGELSLNEAVDNQIDDNERAPQWLEERLDEMLTGGWS